MTISGQAVASTPSKANGVGRHLPKALYVLAALLLAASLVQAWLVRRELPHEPFVWPDSFTYLGPAISAEVGGHWVPTFRQYLYPAFIYAATHFGGSTSAVPAIQHALALGAGLVIAWGWIILLQPVAKHRLRHSLSCLFGVAVVHAFWLSPSLLVYECYLMPEALFLTLSAVEFTTLAWLVGRILNGPIEGRFRLTAPIVCLLAVNTLMYFAVPRWGLATVIVPAAVCALALILRIPRRQLFLAFGLGAAAAAICAAPDFILARRASAPSNYFVEMHLFGVHADMVRNELQRELASQLPRYDRTLLQDCLKAIDRQLELARAGKSPIGIYPSLGFNPDQMMYGGEAPVDLTAHYFHNDPALTAGFFRGFYRDAWLHQPVAMLRKIVRELGHYYHIPSPGLSTAAFSAELRLLVNESAAMATGGYRGVLEPSAIWRGYADRLAADHYATAIGQPALTLALERAGSIVLVPALALAVGGAAFLLLRRRTSLTTIPSLRLVVFAAIFALTALGANLTIAILHSLYPPRYLQANFTLTLLSVAAAVNAITLVGIEVGQKFLASRRRPD